MRFSSCRFAIVGALLVWPSGASAQSSPPAADPAPPAAQPAAAEPQYPVVNIGVLAYLQYDAELENRGGYNAFDVTRGYINITADVARHVRFRLTPDVKRATDGALGGSLAFRVKYAFVEFDDLLGDKSWLRVGAHQTPWLDFEESINRYRVQGQMFAEREGLVPGSSDFGLGFLTLLPGGYGEINAGVYNGEGYTKAEANKFKSVQGRATIRPFPKSPMAKGLRLSVFYDLGWFDAGRPRRHGIAMASFEQPHFTGTLQWVAATQRPDPLRVDAEPRGYSAFAEVRQGLEGWAGIFRYDQFDADRRTPDNSNRRVIAGVAYWLKWSRSRVGLVFNDEIVRYDPARRTPNENRLLAQTHLQF